MSVIVSAVLTSVFDQADAPSRELELSRNEVIALVTALEATGPDQGGIIFLDDFQVGYVATDVNPHALAEIVKTQSAELQAKVACHVNFAVCNNLLLSLSTNDDLRYMDARPCLKVKDVTVDNPQVNWTASHAAEAFRNLGFDYDVEHPASVPARDLLDACEKRLDKVTDTDTIRLYEIAEFALAKGGLDTHVLAA